MNFPPLPRGASMALAVAGALLLAGCFGSDDPEALDPNAGGGDGAGAGDGAGSGGETGGNGDGGGGGGGSGGPGGEGNATTEPGGEGEGNGTVDPSFIVFPFSGSLTLSAGAGGNYVNAGAALGDEILHPFPLEAGATALVAELRWENGQSDLELFLDSASCLGEGTGECFEASNTDGSHLSGDSPVVLRVEDATAFQDLGEWGVRVFAKNAVATGFEGVVTVFYGGMPVPPEYNGLEPGA